MARTPLLRAIQRILNDLNQEHRLTTRRDFVKKTALGVAAALPVVNFIAQSSLARNRKPKDLKKGVSRKPAAAVRFRNEPVCIVGGGVAGLTAAYRLARKGVGVDLFESSQRLGGRIYTQQNFNSDGMFVELGGELVDSIHTDLIHLAQQVGVSLEDFRPEDAKTSGDHYYFAGKHYFNSDILNDFLPLAQALARDINLVFPPGSQWVINYKEHNASGLQFDQMSIHQYLYNHASSGVKKWVLDLVNVAYLIEYGLETQQQSAINMLFLIDPSLQKGFRIFGDSDEALRVTGGNSKLIDALDRETKSTVNRRLGHKLVEIAFNSATQLFQLKFEHAGGILVQNSAQVILTLPFTMLRNVRGIESLGISNVKMQAIRTMGYGTNSKFMLGFQSRPWRTQSGALLATNGSMYSDLPSQTFWETSRLQAGNKGILTNYTGGLRGQNASLSDLTSVLKDLDQIQPGLKAAFDQNKSLMNWSKMPHTLGSYSCPKPGEYTSIYGSQGEPELEGRLLFAGEHCSEWYQGYMNGAIETANNAAAVALDQRGKSTATS